jgi:hypothetical protein
MDLISLPDASLSDACQFAEKEVRTANLPFEGLGKTSTPSEPMLGALSKLKLV